MKIVRFHPEAEAEMFAAARFYQEQAAVRGTGKHGQRSNEMNLEQFHFTRVNNNNTNPT